MILNRWKFYYDEKDFYYYRSSKNLTVKVYPIFSFCFINGPKNIIYWIYDFNNEVAKSKNSLELMLYADMKLSELGYSLDNPFSVITKDENSAMKFVRDSYKAISYFSQK